MAMAPQRYCKGESNQKSFQDAVSRTGAAARMTFKLVGKSLLRPGGLIGGAISLGKNVAKEVIKSNKERKKRDNKAHHKSPPKKKKQPKRKGGKRKRELEAEDDAIMNRRVVEIVERDEDMNFGGSFPEFQIATSNPVSPVARGEYSTFDFVTRDEQGEHGESSR